MADSGSSDSEGEQRTVGMRKGPDADKRLATTKVKANRTARSAQTKPSTDLSEFQQCRSSRAFVHHPPPMYEILVWLVFLTCAAAW